MAEWINPVKDRTSYDVQYVMNLQREYGGYDRMPLVTSDGKNFLDSNENNFIVKSIPECKGAYNATDLNRVNNNMLYLQEVLNEDGYAIELETATRVWGRNDIPTQADFQSYLDDVATIRAAFLQMEGTPEVPTIYGFDHIKANDIETILDDVKTMINRMNDVYYYSNDIYCGEVV